MAHHVGNRCLSASHRIVTAGTDVGGLGVVGYAGAVGSKVVGSMVGEFDGVALGEVSFGCESVPTSSNGEELGCGVVRADEARPL